MGIAISKCFNMLCGTCNKRFSSKHYIFLCSSFNKIIIAEIMLFELNPQGDEREQSVFEIQAYFNSVQSKFLYLFLAS
jgi:hypothetical protein